MNSKLMREFEEFEGLGSQVIDESIEVVDDEDDGQFQPANASLLTSNDIYYEVSDRIEQYPPASFQPFLN